MVQTLEQFIFIHDSLAETVLSGETNIKLSYLARSVFLLAYLQTINFGNKHVLLLLNNVIGFVVCSLTAEMIEFAFLGEQAL